VAEVVRRCGHRGARQRRRGQQAGRRDRADPRQGRTDFRLIAGDAAGQLQQIADQLKATPDAKTVTVKALGQDAIAQLDAIGIKVTTLPDGQVQVDLHDEAARAKFTALMTTLSTASADDELALLTPPAEDQEAFTIRPGAEAASA
jgi:hypothetical protein